MSRTVLIVEDEPELLSLMGDAFKRADIEVHLAGNGETGLELFHALQPDLVITDIVMPAKEGVSLIMDIRKSPFEAPIIAISGGGARSCNDYLRWAKELGANLVLQKPFRMSVLMMMARFLMDKAEQGAASRSSESGPAPPVPDLAELFEDLFEDVSGLEPIPNSF